MFLPYEAIQHKKNQFCIGDEKTNDHHETRISSYEVSSDVFCTNIRPVTESLEKYHPLEKSAYRATTEAMQPIDKENQILITRTEDSTIDNRICNDLRDGYTLQEEKIFRQYNADELDCDALLGLVDAAIEKHAQSSSMYKAAMAVRQEGVSLAQSLTESDIKKWKMSIVLALHVLETPKVLSVKFGNAVNPEHLNSVRLLKDFAEHRAIGKSDGWKRLKGALVMLAGVALIELSLAGIPFSGGTSVGIAVMGRLLIAGGATFFYRNRQKSLSLASSILANESSKRFRV